ncbi:MAG: hypothetical protein IJF03_04450 [Lachnospiraceae bacterium]|nr:hypothetical protein [Lachnospiraceae bacterium]
MKRKKSRFWSFVLSFLPGCTEMYMGFMKTGISLMALFWGLVAIGTILNIGEVMYLTLIVWFYGFFHANNLAGLSQSEIEAMPDDYLFNVDGLCGTGEKLTGSYRKIVSIVLVVLGAGLCIRGVFGMMRGILPQVIIDMYYVICDYLPQLIVGVGIIAIGLTMIKGKKQELLEEFDYGRKEDN